ncbi:MAG TPA: gliding motility-associated C-terminal domain-containing protein [Saprospiraceae bacterium]|nr:gliding motility-associated C-terminal domain-containing protein [Saprospiraceae bacterium]HMQ84708.1 gliding motility-associated C-terminal domain-containing protein [Saprospiraceae bacterium]
MQYNKLHHLIALCVLFFALPLTQIYATHNRAGEITVEQLDCEGLTVRATVTTYTKASSIPADRDTLTICWGDGHCERVARSNGFGNPPQGEFLENDTKKNIYIAEHTYPTRGTYTISMTDPNRNGGIKNVNPPNSDQIRFHIQTTYTLANPQFNGCNSTPVLLQPPVDVGCVGQVFTHNPNARDPDKDSLSYHLVVPLQDVGMTVPNYTWPYLCPPNPTLNNLTIDEVTGDIVWDAPQIPGEYNIAMIIVSYRQGQAIDTVLRDMQILIKECENLPPVVMTPFDEVCVVAGEVLEFEVTATAPIEEEDQLVRLTALGGPFVESISPATFGPNIGSFEEDPVVKVFRWQTACEHISDQYYSVVFKATDNFFGDTSGLATLKTVRIKVVGPAPEDVRAEATSEQVVVNWQKPYFCEDAEDNYFRGFTVWRKQGSNIFPIDTCSPGLDGKGYTKLNNAPIREEADGRYVFIDESVERGRTYCYRILAEFSLATPNGLFFYNRVESLPSDEICVQLSRDIPLITNVDVQFTDVNNGLIGVCWSKPVAEDLDTLLNPGPYRYELLRAKGLNPSDDEFEEIGISFSSDDFASANDTCFVDTGLNTLEEAYSYKVNFYVEGDKLLGATNPASSVFLTITPTDNTNILNWQANVPWTNSTYVVYRQNALGEFEVLATVNEPTFRDTDLLNGKEYCYKVRTQGSYGIVGVINPIFNHSQEACGVPVDNVAPCPPGLEVSNVCDQLIDCTDEALLKNELAWVNPMDLCDETDDVTGYRIYFAPFEGSDFTLIASFDDSGKLDFEHKPELGIAGCYALTAVDTFFNESAFSNIICVDNCPFYNLPNAFTPNGDGHNDLFTPYPYCFIDQVDVQIFNRWGSVVYTTKDPNINWDGRDLQGKEVPEGTYYYTCRYYERRVSGITPSAEILSGYIQLVRGNR